MNAIDGTPKPAMSNGELQNAILLTEEMLRLGEDCSVNSLSIRAHLDTLLLIQAERARAISAPMFTYPDGGTFDVHGCIRSRARSMGGSHR